MLRIDGPVVSGGAAVLVLRGELDLATVPRLEQAVQAAPARAELVLDLRGLDFVDSTGLSALLRIDGRAREAGGALCCLVPAEGAVRRVIEMTRLEELLEVREPPPA